MAHATCRRDSRFGGISSPQFLNDLRRELAARGPAMITISFVQSRRQATAGDGWLLTTMKSGCQAQHVVVYPSRLIASLRRPGHRGCRRSV